MTTQSHAVGVEDDRAILARVVVRRAGGREAGHAAQARRHVLALRLCQQGESESELHRWLRRAGLVTIRCQAVWAAKLPRCAADRAGAVPWRSSDLRGTDHSVPVDAGLLRAACAMPFGLGAKSALPKLFDPIRCPSRHRCSDDSHTSPHAPLGPKHAPLGWVLGARRRRVGRDHPRIHTVC